MFHGSAGIFSIFDPVFEFLEPVFQFLPVLVFTVCKSIYEILTVDVWCSSFPHPHRPIFERLFLEYPVQYVELFFDSWVKQTTRHSSAL